jgi:hypothetical protein
MRSYEDMACCGGKKRVSTVKNSDVKAAPVSSMPGEKDGLVLAEYIGGKGKAKHYYRGNVTKFPYKISYGQILYVDLRDINDASHFKRVVKEKVEVQSTQPALKSARLSTVSRQPVQQEIEVVEPIDIPDIQSMNYKLVLAWLEETKPSDELAAKVLEIEKSGKNRKRVISFIERRLK